MFSHKQDIEIAGLLTALFSWGQRKTIINKAKSFFELMDFAPHDFVLNFETKDLKPFAQFKHRTFNGDDALCFISFFNWYYSQFQSLEYAFIDENCQVGDPVEAGINRFHALFLDHPHFLKRSEKHVSAPYKKSTCKRINMFLRWMVRKDPVGIDFGVWNRINASDLKIPMDVHVFRMAKKLGLLRRNQADWQAVVELTEMLKLFDPDDPVKYDYALFGMSVMKWPEIL